MDFTIYDPLTGEILRSGASHDHYGAWLQCRDGENIIIGEALRDDLFVVKDGKPVDRVITDTELDQIKANLCISIDAEAGFARGRFLSSGKGQDYIYTLKLNEAERMIRDAAPAAEVPLIAAEAESDGMALAQKASQIVKAARQAASSLAAIEVARRSAKRAVMAAKGRDEAKAAALVDWPT